MRSLVLAAAVAAATVAPLALSASPALASADGYGLYASCVITADDPYTAFVQIGGSAGNGVTAHVSLQCSQGETVAMQGRLQRLSGGVWSTVATGDRLPNASGYQTLGSGGTAATIGNYVSNLPCSNGTYRSWNLANINGTQHSAYSASVSIVC